MIRAQQGIIASGIGAVAGFDPLDGAEELIEAGQLDGTHSDGDPVSQIVGQKSNYTYDNTAGSPATVLKKNIQNSRSVIRYNGASERLRDTTNVTLTTGITFVYVIDITSPGGTVFFNRMSSADLYALVRDDDEIKVYGTDNTVVVDTDDFVPDPVVSNWWIITMVYDFAHSKLNVYINSANPQASATAAAGEAPPAQYMNLLTSTGYPACDLAAWAIYLTAKDVSWIEDSNTYWGTRYNITIANTFDPTTILDHIWDADDLTGSDGDAQSTWGDSVGSWDWDQSTGAMQPKLYNDVINGHKTLRWDGSDDQMYLGSGEGDDIFSGGGTFIFVAKGSVLGGRITDKDAKSYVVPDTGNDAGYRVAVAPTYTDGLSKWLPDDNHMGSDYEFSVVIIRFDCDDPANDAKFDINGVSVDVGMQNRRTGTYVSDASSVMYLGNRADGARAFTGDFAWIGYVAGELSDANTKLLGMYLKERFT